MQTLIIVWNYKEANVLVSDIQWTNRGASDDGENPALFNRKRFHHVGALRVLAVSRITEGRMLF